MTTHFRPDRGSFGRIGGREVVAAFDGGYLSSDGGALLLDAVERRTRIIERVAECFEDFRDPRRVDHSVRELVAQRVMGIALGYEDLNDHDRLRVDPLLAAVVGKRDPTGLGRSRGRDRGKALAGKSTLNRFELSQPRTAASSRYKRIAVDVDAVDRLFVELFLDAHDQSPDEIVLDLDTTDDAIHGRQEGRFFHGYYGHYCYLPLYVFCGSHLLCARLRTADRDAAAGCVDEIQRIVRQIRERWPEVDIVIRGDSGFAREALMSWCEANQVEFILGLARNSRLEAELAEAMAEAKRVCEQTEQPHRVFHDFSYSTLDTWTRSRRVVGKAEYIPGKANPRFVVTSLDSSRVAARPLYEQLYCARGDMENRIKEQQLALFADRTSTATMFANQLRLWFSSVAYLLLDALRRIGLPSTQLGSAQCGTIRVRLLKIGARVCISTRRVVVSLASAFPLAREFLEARRRLVPVTA